MDDDFIINSQGEIIRSTKKIENNGSWITTLLWIILILMVAAGFLGYQEFDKEITRSKEYSSELLDQINNAKSEYNSLAYEKNLLENDLNRLKSIEFYSGVKTNESNSNGANYDNGYKVFFQVKNPIKLNSVYVAASETGYINIDLTNTNGTVISSHNVYISTARRWTKISLDFEIPNTGYYNLSYTGNLKLYYISNGFNYNDFDDSSIKITGVGKGNRSNQRQTWYQYFFEWNYSLI